MKEKRYFLFGLVFGLLLGWASGYLRLPYIETNASFWPGFTTGLACAALALVLPAVWSRTFLPGLAGKQTAAANSDNTRKHHIIRITLAGVLLLGSAAGGFAVFRRIESFKWQIQNQEKQLQHMTALVAAMRKQDQGPLMRSVLEQVAEELKRRPAGPLSDAAIERIAALTFAARPYPYIQADTVSEQAYSPERGHLLKALLLLRIDTGSFARIKRQVRFDGADLQGADLKGLNLSGIHLEKANLKDADLSGADLRGANLREAGLWGANLNRADLGRADMKRAELNWAKLNEATLTSANLDGANLASAQLRKAELNAATVQYADMTGALLDGANLTRVIFFSSDLTRAHLNRANLEEADLRMINLSEAGIIEAQWDKALVDDNWPDQLKKWCPKGMEAMQEKYRFVSDTADAGKSPLYRLRKN